MIEKQVRRYREILGDYEFRDDIMDDDEEIVRRLKYIINRRLCQVDRTLLLLYADCGSYRKLGKRLGISHMTMRKEIMRIREKITEEYGNIFKDDAGIGGGGLHR